MKILCPLYQKRTWVPFDHICIRCSSNVLLNPKIVSLQDLIFYLVSFSLLWLSKYQLTMQQGRAQQGDQCTDTQADHVLKVALVPA